jgi:hypothetical protein
MAHILDAQLIETGVRVSSECDQCGRRAEQHISHALLRNPLKFQDAVYDSAKVLDGLLAGQGCACGGMTPIERGALLERVALVQGK